MDMSTCSQCRAPTPVSSLSMSLDGNGMTCPACSLAARTVQDKKGMTKAYLTGAVIVGIALLYVVARVLAHW